MTCALVLVDVENAFNSLSWRVILDELARRGVTGHLRGVMTAACWECGDPEDDANHAIFHCPAGETRRKTLELKLGAKLDPDNLVAAAIKSPSTWRALRAFAFETIRPREEKERREERMYRG
ncbi:hypothetical protein KM043_012395 [Ampulex compressa]|nr:hypothetical protein KM043_012395 [Ampulex compressa]